MFRIVNVSQTLLKVVPLFLTQVKEKQKHDTTLKALFRPFKPLSGGQQETLLKQINVLMLERYFAKAVGILP